MDRTMSATENGEISLVYHIFVSTCTHIIIRMLLKKKLFITMPTCEVTINISRDCHNI